MVLKCVRDVAIIGVIIAVSAIGLPGCTPKTSEEAKIALAALHRVEAQIQVGTTLKEYAAALVDAKVAVNHYDRTSEAKNESKLAEAIKGTLADFEFAKHVWQLATEQASAFPPESILLADPRARQIVTRYPKTEAVMEGPLARQQMVNLSQAAGFNFSKAATGPLIPKDGDGAVFISPYLENQPGVSTPFAKGAAKIMIGLKSLTPPKDPNRPFARNPERDEQEFLNLDVATKIVLRSAIEKLAAANALVAN